jgi:putative RNase toxin 11 of polymorphic toxin system
MRGHERHPGKVNRPESVRGRAVPAGTRTPARIADADWGPTQEAVTAWQGTAGNAAVDRMIRDAGGAPPGRDRVVPRAAGDRAVAMTVQRAGEESAPAPERPGRDARIEEAIERLSRSIGEHTVLPKMKTNVWDPLTWIPEKWIPGEKLRLRRTLLRRLVRGEVFNAQELADIRALSEANHKWLSEMEIGTYAEAEDYATKGDFTGWVNLSPGRRLLTATLAFSQKRPGTRASSDRIPADPAYTLGRFMTTQGGGLSEDERKALFDERDEQIRQTAVSTLHPAGLRPEDRHAKADTPEVTDYATQDENARDILTSVLLILQQGLKIYDPQQKKHIDESEHDVIRALAHGGRVNIRIPAVRKGESPFELTDFIGITESGKYTQYVTKRDFATHRSSIGKNKDGEPGTGSYKEKGGIGASITNVLAPAVPGVDDPDIRGVNFSGGGLGSKDVNGDVVLPNGSHGHMLLIFHAPTEKKDGSLQVGLETIGPHAYSPVGYEHTFRSTETTANPESVLHGHKEDKTGGGKLGDNQRLVNLSELTGTQPGGAWRAFLDQIKREWLGELNRTQEGSQAREDLYRRLVGRRQNLS